MSLFILNSSIGRKLVMSLSGLFLIVFLLVHLTINSFLLVGPDAFRAGCKFMELPFVMVMVPVLADGFIIHILYAGWLTLQNMKARGNVAYASGKKSETKDWASKNMFVIGVIVLGFIGLHLSHFWAEMQLQKFMGTGKEVDPYTLVATQFRHPVIGTLYIVWYVALWFHLTHGFWSAFQTIGLNNTTWYCRLKVIGTIFATIICLGFALITSYFLFGLAPCC
jgi:succinate dehydrogenase / fumarate reductase cytochrome b subunit